MGFTEWFGLEGKTALVTGGSRGLGREMALCLAEAGANVILTGRTQETLDEAARDIRVHAHDVQTVKVDMAVAGECESACKRIVAEMPAVDILINNVGNRQVNVPIAEETLATWHEMMDLNLTSCFLATKIFGGAMVKRGNGGRIINVSSISAMIANRGIGGRHYETSKAAVQHFTRCAAADWAPHGVTVNAICPGLFMTDANKKWNDTKPEVIGAFVKNVPMGRAGIPQEIGPLAVYLASPAAAYVTGASFVIDGGYTLW